MSSPTKTKPTIIFVPGAWHSPSCFEPTTTLLEAAGYKCVGVALPSIGASPPLESFDDDVDAVAAEIEKAADKGEEVLLFMHSYGGVVGSAAVTPARTRPSRSSSNKPGGVTQLFYCCAFALPIGISLMDALQNTPLPWFSISPDSKIVTPQTPASIFYNDIADPSALIASLKPHSYATFASKQTAAPWADDGANRIGRTYLYCERDAAIPVAAQRGMVEGSGVVWREEWVDAGHSPFVSVPAETARAVRRAAAEDV